MGDGFLLIASDCECWIASATHPALLFTASLSERPQAVPSPLSERGRRGSNLDTKSFNITICIEMYCVAIPSWRGVPKGRGVSHSKTQVAKRQTLRVAPSEYFSTLSKLE